MIHYIYTLSNPTTNEVRYVGKTINIKRRYKQHLYDKRQTSHKSSWITSLKLINLKPILRVIEECTNDNWEDRERFWITQFDNLTNIKTGGNGGDDYKRTLTSESIEKIRTANKNKIVSDEQKAKISKNNGANKKVSIDNVIYNSIANAVTILGLTHFVIYYRLKSNKYPNYLYI